MAFDPKRHVIKVQGNREYLPVSARLIWFRQDHPDWGIVTSPVEINMEKQYAIFSASIFNAEGKLMATATKMENIRGFGDYLEKAETGAVGRALAYCGYGTQFAPELEEGGRLSDSPYPPGSNRFAPSGGNGGNGGGYRANGGGSGARPMPAPLQQRPTAPAPPPAREVMADDFDPDAEALPPTRAASPAAAARPAPPSARPTPAPPAVGGENSGITRVREPERDFGDPGGPEDEDDEDPFADEDAPVAAAPSRPAAAQPARANAPAAPASGEKTRCSVEGCPATLLPGQVTMSMAKFGRPLCPIHQKEAGKEGAPSMAGAGAGGGNRRGRSSEDALEL